MNEHFPTIPWADQIRGKPSEGRLGGNGPKHPLPLLSGQS